MELSRRTFEDPITGFLIVLFHLALVFFALSGELFGRGVVSAVVGIAALVEGAAHSVAFFIGSST